MCYYYLIYSICHCIITLTIINFTIAIIDKMDAVAQLMGSYSPFESGSSSDDESQSSASSAGQQAGSDNLSQQNNVAAPPVQQNENVAPVQQNENVPPNNVPQRQVLNEQQEQELNEAVEAFVPSVGLSDYEAKRERNIYRNEYRLYLLDLGSKPSAVRYVYIFKVCCIVYI